MYEDYMQNILGYRMNPQQNTYEQYNNQGEECYQYDNYMPMMQYENQMSSNMNVDLEACYPEIYRIIYPMIRKACMQNTSPITEETIDRMVTEIYTNIEAENVINLNINLGNTVGGTSTSENRESVEKKEGEENRTNESRQRNFLLNDLIRILLIRELLGRPGGIRRPFPPRPFPPRPPMGRPPMNRPPMNRPPMMPRYDEYPIF